MSITQVIIISCFVDENDFIFFLSNTFLRSKKQYNNVKLKFINFRNT